MSVSFALAHEPLSPTPERLKVTREIAAVPEQGFMLGAHRAASRLEISSLYETTTADSVVHALPNDVRTVSRTSSNSTSLAERLFDTLVQLKVATAQYAMHLTPEARARLFGEFDYLLDEEGWHEGDRLPTLPSYTNFLKWLVFTSDCSWSSLGISDQGTIMAAWVRDQNRLTADFAERVRWSQAVLADGEMQTSAGQYSLEHFAKTASGFLVAFRA